MASQRHIGDSNNNAGLPMINFGEEGLMLDALEGDKSALGGSESPSAGVASANSSSRSRKSSKRAVFEVASEDEIFTNPSIRKDSSGKRRNVDRSKAPSRLSDVSNGEKRANNHGSQGHAPMESPVVVMTIPVNTNAEKSPEKATKSIAGTDMDAENSSNTSSNDVTLQEIADIADSGPQEAEDDEIMSCSESEADSDEEAEIIRRPIKTKPWKELIDLYSDPETTIAPFRMPMQLIKNNEYEAFSAPIIADKPLVFQAPEPTPAYGEKAAGNHDETHPASQTPHKSVMELADKLLPLSGHRGFLESGFPAFTYTGWSQNRRVALRPLFTPRVDNDNLDHVAINPTRRVAASSAIIIDDFEEEEEEEEYEFDDESDQDEDYPPSTAQQSKHAKNAKQPTVSVSASVSASAPAPAETSVSLAVPTSTVGLGVSVNVGGRSKRILSSYGLGDQNQRPQYNDSNDNFCSICGKGGELLLCDFQDCNRSYHLACVKLPVVPEGEWNCPMHGGGGDGGGGDGGRNRRKIRRREKDTCATHSKNLLSGEKIGHSGPVDSDRVLRLNFGMPNTTTTAHTHTHSHSHNHGVGVGPGTGFLDAAWKAQLEKEEETRKNTVDWLWVMRAFNSQLYSANWPPILQGNVDTDTAVSSEDLRRLCGELEKAATALEWEKEKEKGDVEEDAEEKEVRKVAASSLVSMLLNPFSTPPNPPSSSTKALTPLTMTDFISPLFIQFLAWQRLMQLQREYKEKYGVEFEFGGAGEKEKQKEAVEEKEEEKEKLQAATATTDTAHRSPSPSRLHQSLLTTVLQEYEKREKEKEKYDPSATVEHILERLAQKRAKEEKVKEKDKVVNVKKRAREEEQEQEGEGGGERSQAHNPKRVKVLMPIAEDASESREEGEGEEGEEEGEEGEGEVLAKGTVGTDMPEPNVAVSVPSVKYINGELVVTYERENTTRARMVDDVEEEDEEEEEEKEEETEKENEHEHVHVGVDDDEEDGEFLVVYDTDDDSIDSDFLDDPEARARSKKAKEKEKEKEKETSQDLQHTKTQAQTQGPPLHSILSTDTATLLSSLQLPPPTSQPPSTAATTVQPITIVEASHSHSVGDGGGEADAQPTAPPLTAKPIEPDKDDCMETVYNWPIIPPRSHGRPSGYVRFYKKGDSGDDKPFYVLPMRKSILVVFGNKPNPVKRSELYPGVLEELDHCGLFDISLVEPDPLKAAKIHSVMYWSSNRKSFVYSVFDEHEHDVTVNGQKLRNMSQILRSTDRSQAQSDAVSAGAATVNDGTFIDFGFMHCDFRGPKFGEKSKPQRKKS